MKIAIYAQYYKEKYEEYLFEIVSCLQASNDEVFIYDKLYNPLQTCDELKSCSVFSRFEDLDNSFDAMLTIGGDGTILRAVTYIRNLDIPVLGINAGRLGFLATVSKQEIAEMISSLRKKEYKIIERSVIQISPINEKDSENKGFGELNFALNEVTISRKNTTSMITIDTFLDDEFLTSYWADGLILATPTGSTGYSLSCGGPVIMPEVGSFVITPIAPHNLNARPLIISDKIKIQLRVYSREDNYYISLDSRMISLPCSEGIIVSKADFNIQMIELKTDSFLKTIRKKLLWGEDKRN